MSNEAAGPWPTWDELFPPTPDPGTEPVPNRGDPGSMMGRLLRGDPNNWDNKNQRYPAPDYGPAPDPNMAPEGMVANPYYNLPGNAQYISADQAAQLADLNSFYTRDGGYRYDAYDATLQTPGNDLYQSPAQLGYDPGAPWQRQEDYYAALKAKNDLGQATIGNYTTGWVDNTTTPGRGGQNVKTSIYDVRAIPKGYDMRQGNYYQPDGTVGAQNNLYVPGDPLFFGISDKEKDFIPANMSYVDYAMSREINPDQPRANALGQQGVGLGGVISQDMQFGPGTPSGAVLNNMPASLAETSAYDYLRRMTPANVVIDSKGTTAKDANPFRGRVGTSTFFTAEPGDTVDMYPGVSFYSANTDGTFTKVSTLTPNTNYYAIRESYDYTGFPVNTDIQKAGKGENLSIRIGDGGPIKVADLDPSINLTGATFTNPATGERKFFTTSDINDLFGGEIPAGATLLVTKTTDGNVYSSNKVDVKNKTLLFNDGTAAGVMLPPQDYAKAKAGLPYWNPTVQGTVDPKTGKVWVNNGTASGLWVTPAEFASSKDKQPFWDDGIKAYVDPVSTKIWRNEQEGWVDRPDGVPPTPAAPGTTPAQGQPPPASTPEDFSAQMQAYLGSFYGQSGPNGLTMGKSGSIYPDYSTTDPTLESFSGDGWVIPIAASTAGANVVDIKKAAGGGKVWVFNPTDKDPNNWDEVKSGTIQPGVRYVIVLSNSAIKSANDAANKVKK